MSTTLAAVHSTPLTVERAVGELATETPSRILAAFADLALQAPTLASHTPCRCVGILPARYKSSRLPGKLMLPLHGKKVLQRTWEAACRAKGLDLVLIACDDEIIKKEAESWGAKVIMTSTKWINGTERLSEVVPQLPAECQIVVNIQGDEPFTNPDHVELTVSSMLACLDDPKVACAQLYAPCLGGEEEVNSTATVKVVLDMNGYCLFQSRAVIPHTKEGNYVPSYPYLKFVGVTAFRKDFIPLYATHPGTQCQLHEDVEYNKVLEMGYKIKMERIEFAEIGVNTQEDYEYLLNNYQHCADPSAEPSAEQSAEQSAAQDRAKDLVEAARQ